MALNVGFYISFDQSFTGGPRVVYNFVTRIDKDRFSPLVITNKHSPLTEHLDQAGIKYVIVPQHPVIGDQDGQTVQGGLLARANAVGHVWRYNRKIQAILKEHKCDLLWVRNIKGVLLTGIAAKRRGIPLIWDIGMEKPSKGIFRRFYDVGFRLATTVITEANCVAKSIFTEHQLRTHAKKLAVVKSGIPDDRVAEIITARRDCNRTDDEIRIINLASICDRKNQAMIVGAVLPLVDEFPNLKVSFVGPSVEDDYTASLKSRISSAGAESNFEFLGWRNDAVKLLVASDLFLLASKVEGVPYSVLESMHARIPVVSTRCGGVPDVILDGVTGLTMEIGDEAGMTAAIRKTISDTDFSDQVTANANEFVLENHTAEKWCGRYMDLFEQLKAKH